jgi:E3 Ubiquitin ligase
VFMFFTALPLAGAAICVFAGWRAWRQAAVIKSTPTSNIGMASDGYREFEGYAEAIGGELLTSPLTLSPCVWYQAKVEKWERASGGDSSGNWAPVKKWTSATPFIVRDATGACIVDPLDAEVTPSDKSQWYGNKVTPSDRNPPRLDPGQSGQPMFEGNARYRYFEERIYADSPLLVLGEFSRGQFASGDVEPDDEDDEETGAPLGDEDAVAARVEKLGRAVTRARISRGRGRKPFIISTQLQAVHVAMSEMGNQAAVAMALAFTGLAALMVWARVG